MGYELSSLSKNIIYELLLNFNGNIENFVIFYSNLGALNGTFYMS